MSSSNHYGSSGSSGSSHRHHHHRHHHRHHQHQSQSSSRFSGIDWSSLFANSQLWIGLVCFILVLAVSYWLSRKVFG